MPDDRLGPLQTFLSAVAVSSFAGLAALLRSNKEITLRSVLTAIIYSGTMGLTIALLWFNYGRDNVYFLLGVCALAGIGGTSLLDFIVLVLKHGGVKITINPDDD